MDKKTVLGIVGLVVLFAFFIAFRVFYQQGAKLLEGNTPLMMGAFAVILGLLGFFAFKFTKKK